MLRIFAQASYRSRAILRAACLPQQFVAHVSSLAEIPVDCFQTAISPAVCQSLQQRGYAVVDNVFGLAWNAKLKRELIRLKAENKMHLNSTHLVKQGGTELLEKQHVYEAELRDADIQQSAPLCQVLNEDSTMRTMLSLFMPHVRLDSQAIKLQCNAGSGGCFPLHYDSDEQVDGRRVTAIFYLNTDWHPSHGGQLQLFPFPDPPVAIAPIADRLVLFSSCRMLHRVLPSLKERYCFTIWLSQTRKMSAASSPSLSQILQSGHDSQQHIRQLLLRPDVRHHLSKLLYADEWATSIQESHPVSEARSVTLAKHWEDVSKIKEALQSVQNTLLQVLQNRQLYHEVMAGAKTAWF